MTASPLPSRRVRLVGIHAGPGYYPVFVADELGLFAAQGLTVEFTVSGHGSAIAKTLLAGDADIALGGMWRPLMYHGRIGDLVAFAQVNARCYLWAVSRIPVPNAGLTSLVGRSVVIPGGSPSVWAYVAGLLRERGIEPSKVTFLRDFADTEGVDLFAAGLGDVILLGPGAAEQIAAEGRGHLAFPLAEGGLSPWSVLFTRSSSIDRDGGETAGRLVAGLREAFNWVRLAERGDHVEICKRRLGTLPLEVCLNAIEGCKQNEIWPRDVEFDDSSVSRWQEMLIAAGLLHAPIDPADAVDERPMKWTASG
jgi:NitT/TauT family transport system substrate-binding protein